MTTDLKTSKVENLQSYFGNALQFPDEKNLPIKMNTHNHGQHARKSKFQPEAPNKIERKMIAGVFLFLSLIVLHILIVRNKGGRIGKKKQKEEILGLRAQLLSRPDGVQELPLQQEEKKNQKNPDQEKLKYLQDMVDDLQCTMFRMRPIYTKIQQLSEQRKIPKERKKVLTLQDRIILKEEITVCFAELIHRLKTAFPSIKDEEIELCCLIKLGLPLTVICLCFGFVESDSLRQRKYQLKRKMEKGNSPELLHLIFETRDTKKTI
ncbi:MAG: hypothetical protein FWF52_04165 [Candidatus Azobacteroides sp.]|nr:hypothetical protein [Candidatus Azobacteroides sp.]